MKLIELTCEQYSRLYNFLQQTWWETYRGIVSDDHIEFLLHKYTDVQNVLAYAAAGYKYYYISDGVNHTGLIVYVDRGHDIYIDKLYVLSAYRSRGFASFAVRELIKFGKDITLNVNRRNKKAIEFYKHMGFDVDKIVDLNVADGMVNDDYIMRRKSE